MKVTVYNTKPYVEQFFRRTNSQFNHEFVFFSEQLNEETAELARGTEAVCIFVNDTADAAVLERLHEVGVKLIALR